ncbi:hypothetical protein IMG5_197690 [Ichthyophthirius multifiliis]|uniref:Transmembrane protein n=1 Tax=Ichthyophthirius multifiliis TaxID=5932 RepID=G0R5C1_ICHMU|nr:hypothetical protein IMG5_197690 [Ichthyophthirius multifiliis]EGR27334.1 hypothetical protein IMG5_197690 [Ichthyophthirius multifiliis]|eukprot:XP_004024218.1 hypothetical protein IMG5_197690 [Ichthyophthirius multifiliis]
MLQAIFYNLQVQLLLLYQYSSMLIQKNIIIGIQQILFVLICFLFQYFLLLYIQLGIVLEFQWKELHKIQKQKNSKIPYQKLKMQQKFMIYIYGLQVLENLL